MPLLNNTYVRAAHFGKLAFRSIITGYLQRVASLLSLGKYDLVWIDKEFLPWVPHWIERLLVNSAVPYVVDYDDAVFHKYDQHESAWVRSFLGGKIDHTMRRARIVVAGNEYLAQRAIVAGAERVEILPTVVDVSRYTVSSGSANSPFCVGWIGQGSTVQYLKMIEPIMRTLYKEGAVTLRVVGPAKWSSSSCPFQLRTWSEATEAADASAMDVGVMPLRDDDWERGKCGYKLIQYMATGIPVVASPVGINTEIVDHGVTGFLAKTEGDWLGYLRRLRDDPALRRKMGDAGRKKTEAHYSQQVIAPRLAAILKSAVAAK